MSLADIWNFIINVNIFYVIGGIAILALLGGLYHFFETSESAQKGASLVGAIWMLFLIAFAIFIIFFESYL